jgi:hypothetical protein
VCSFLVSTSLQSVIIYLRSWLAAGFSVETSVREKSKFVKQSNADSTVRSSRERYFTSVYQNLMIVSRRPDLDKRGALRSSRTLKAGCDGRGRTRQVSAANLARTTVPDADGEVVWSWWAPTLGTKLRGDEPHDHGAKKPKPGDDKMPLRFSK